MRMPNLLEKIVFFFLGVINITEWKSSAQRMIDHIERILHIKNKKAFFFHVLGMGESKSVLDLLTGDFISVNNYGIHI